MHTPPAGLPARSHSRLFLAVIGVVLLGACSGSEPQSSPRIEPVTKRDIVVTATAAGVVEPVNLIEVKSKASGEIVEVLVEEGDHVNRGQLLVRVDPRVPRNAVVQAEADSVVARAELDNASAQLERAEALHQTDAITDLEYEAAKLAHATANAALIRARRALEDARIAFEDTEVRAPVSGVIIGRDVEAGTVIASASREIGGGSVLLRMASLDTVQVRALVDETDIGMVRPGLPVRITVAAYPNRPFEGQVERIAPEAQVEQNVTMFPVLARIPNRQGLLRPGMNAEVEIRIGSVRNALTVPNAALRPLDESPAVAGALGLSADSAGQLKGAPRPERSVARAGGAGPNELFGGSYLVYVWRDSGPEPVQVKTGLTDYDYTAVLEGLEPDDSVLILPTAGLLTDQAERQTRIRQRVGGALGQ